MLFKNSMVVSEASSGAAARPLRILSWCAVSSTAQGSEDKESLPEQRRQNELFVQQFGKHYPGREAVLVDTLEVVGSRSIVSLSDAARTYPQYAMLEQMVQAGAVDAVVLRETSRLGRNRALVTSIEELARAHGCVIIPRHGARPDLEGNDDGNAIVSAVQSALSQQEVAQLMRRKEMGMRGRIKNRRPFAYAPPYGYRNVRDPKTGKVTRVEVVPEQAAVVRLIFLDLYLQREMGEPAIATELNRLGIPTPSQLKAQEGDQHVPSEEWTFSSVHQILNRLEAYAGYVYYGRKSGQPYIADGGYRKTPQRKPVTFEKGEHEAILSQQEVESVLAEKAERTFSPRSRAWSGSAVCANCDQLMVGTTVGGLVDGKRARLDAMKCPSCGQTVKDEALREAVEKALDVLEQLADDAELEQQVASAPNPAVAELAALERKRTELDARRKRLLDGLEAGRLSDEEYDERADALARERAETVRGIERAQAALAAHVDVGQRAERLAEVRASGRALLAQAEKHPDIVRRWLKAHVRAIVRPRKVGGRGVNRVTVEFV